MSNYNIRADNAPTFGISFQWYKMLCRTVSPMSVLTVICSSSNL